MSVATTPDPLIGRAIDGRYLIKSRIARGGMATVYIAFDKRLSRDVAVKVMHQHLAQGVDGAAFVSGSGVKGALRPPGSPGDRISF